MARGRRGKGEGTIIYIASRQEYRGAISTLINGKPDKVYFYSGKGGKKSEVARQMNEWRLENDPEHAVTEDVTVETGIKVWLSVIKQPDLKPASFDRLESTIDRQIIPRIGKYNIKALTDSIIKKELIDAMTEEGLSISSTKKAYDALHAYLKYALYYHMIDVDPMGMMSPPKDEGIVDASEGLDEDEGDIQPLSDEEIAALYNILVSKWKTGNDRYPMGYAFIFVLNTGLRMGEALALRWPDIDFKNNDALITKNLIVIKNRDGGKNKYRLVVQNTPKSDRSRRKAPLNKAAIHALTELKKKPGYSDNGYVIRTKDGKPMLPRSFQETLDLACVAAGVRKIGLHTLRHTYATRLFEAGVDVKIISELLGHSSTEITYRIYIHIIERLKREAVHEALDFMPNVGVD